MSMQDRDWYREYDEFMRERKKQEFRKKWIPFIVGGALGLILVFFVRFYFNISFFDIFSPLTVQHSQVPPDAQVPQSFYIPKSPDTPKPFNISKSEILSSSSKSVTVQYVDKGSINIKYFTVDINGVPFDVMFDTGASFVSLNSDTIKTLGIKSFESKGLASTAGGMAETYNFLCSSIRLGSIEITNVECSYSPANPHNLLGGSFLKHFNYSLNENDKTITFVLKDEPVYISKEGNVKIKEGDGFAEINGKKYQYRNGKFYEN